MEKIVRENGGNTHDRGNCEDGGYGENKGSKEDGVYKCNWENTIEEIGREDGGI